MNSEQYGKSGQKETVPRFRFSEGSKGRGGLDGLGACWFSAPDWVAENGMCLEVVDGGAEVVFLAVYPCVSVVGDSTTSRSADAGFEVFEGLIANF